MNMAINAHGDGLRYRGDQDKYSVYELVIKHRPVLEIVVDNTDEDLTINVAKPGTVFSLVTGISMNDSKPVLVPTGGRARRNKHIKPEMESVVKEFTGTPEEFINVYPDAFIEHIDGISVYGYVMPRSLYLIADVFVPIDGGFDHNEN